MRPIAHQLVRARAFVPGVQPPYYSCPAVPQGTDSDRYYRHDTLHDGPLENLYADFSAQRLDVSKHVFLNAEEIMRYQYQPLEELPVTPS